MGRNSTLKSKAPAKPLLTVLVPTYNHEATIARALDSILAQQTAYPYVIWICEDCSTDGTLAICRRYAKRYPDRIKLIAQPVNTKALYLREVMLSVKTKYFGLLDGDDYWTDPAKIQTALSVLEANPQYQTFAHDTRYEDVRAKTKLSLVHDIHKAKIKNPVSFEAAPYLHTSARIHRNNIDLSQHFTSVQDIGDIYLFYLYLDKGPLYYHDAVMSAYTISGTGAWSKLSDAQQRLNMELAAHNSNRVLLFRRDAFFSAKVARPKRLRVLKRLLGRRLGWRVYIFQCKHSSLLSR